ncbi:unnamed protein product, partial [Neisseria lactamica Y92-1009]
YCPVGKVLAVLFAQIKKLYGIGSTEITVPVWHKDVRYSELQQNGETIGGVYMDLYAREGKRGGAWMNDYKGRRRFADGTLQLPTAYLVCNFTPPVGGREARLSHDEILTLFHETGHGLHHLLTQVDELGVSGINGVEWDAVELPSQIMENFVWEYNVLMQMSAHEETGVPLVIGHPRPRTTINGFLFPYIFLYRLLSNSSPFFSRLNAMTASLRMMATMITLGGLPFALSLAVKSGNAPIL